MNKKLPLIIALFFFISFFSTLKVHAETATFGASEDATYPQSGGDPLDPMMEVGYYRTYSGPEYTNSYIKFDFPGIPEDATINKAIMTLTARSFNIYDSPPISGVNLRVYRVVDDWSEQDFIDDVLFRPYTTGAGTKQFFNYFDDPISEFKIDITNYVQGWVEETIDNYGLKISGESADIAYYINFYAKDTNSYTFRPSLYVEYETADYSSNDDGSDPAPVADDQDDETLEIKDITLEWVTDSTAKITWKTNEGAYCYLEYGENTEYGKAANAYSQDNNHEVTLYGLVPNTTYNYQVVAEGGSDNTDTSENKTFTTSPPEEMTGIAPPWLDHSAPPPSIIYTQTQPSEKLPITGSTSPSQKDPLNKMFESSPTAETTTSEARSSIYKQISQAFKIMFYVASAVTVFVLGLALGSWIKTKKKDEKEEEDSKKLEEEK